MNSYRELIVWQKSMQLVRAVYCFLKLYRGRSYMLLIRK